MRFALSILAPLMMWPMLALAAAYGDDFARSVVKVRAVGANGSVTFGSAVVIAPNRLATTCHVTRDARTVEIYRGFEHWVADSQVGSVTHDLCVLTVRALELPAVPLRHAAELDLGEHVTAVGFQGGGDALVYGEGKVERLYRYEDGQVIRTSAPFDFGSSGGGLFDAAGRLVGLLAFKTRTAAPLRFALPADWIAPESPVASAFSAITPAYEEKAFWERPKASRPAFLGVAVHEATQ